MLQILQSKFILRPQSALARKEAKPQPHGAVTQGPQGGSGVSMALFPSAQPSVLLLLAFSTFSLVRHVDSAAGESLAEPGVEQWLGQQWVPKVNISLLAQRWRSGWGFCNVKPPSTEIPFGVFPRPALCCLPPLLLSAQQDSSSCVAEAGEELRSFSLKL